MSAPKARTKEIAALLLLVATGALKPKVEGAPWHDVYAGNVYFDVIGYKIVIFNDCDSWDYIDSVVFLDGTKVDFGEWHNDTPPDVLLFNETPELNSALEAAFENAT